MNNIISEKNKKRYLPHDINTRKFAVEMYRHCGVRIDIWTHFMRGCIIDYVH